MAGEDKKTNALCTHVCNSNCSSSSSRSSCNKRHTHVAPSSVAPPAPSGSPHPHSCHIEFSNIWLATFFFAIFLATSINGSHGLAILFFPRFFFQLLLAFCCCGVHCIYLRCYFFPLAFFLYAALTPKNILSPKKTKTKQSFHQRSSSSSSRKLHAQHDYP